MQYTRYLCGSAFYRVHLFLALLQLMQLGLAQLSESSPGTQLVRNGPAGTDQFPSWELSYYAANYRPICGLSFEAEGFYYWSNSGECEPAMSTFNVTMDSFAMYDTSGIRRRGNSEDEIASGSALCYCFTLLTPQNVMMNICFLIGGGGEVRLKAGVAVGVFDPSSVSEKALPLCKNVNLSTVISSIDATSQNKGTPTEEGTETPISTTRGGQSPSTAESGKSLSRSDKIALGVGLGCGIPTIILSAIAICYKRR